MLPHCSTELNTDMPLNTLLTEFPARLPPWHVPITESSSHLLRATHLVSESVPDKVVFWTSFVPCLYAAPYEYRIHV